MILNNDHRSFLVLNQDKILRIQLQESSPIFDKFSGHKLACEQAVRDALAEGREKEGSLQLRLWNFNSFSNSLVALRRLNCQISANQRETETSANVNKH